MSRTGLSPADIAESFRDRCGDGSVEWTYTPMQTWVLLDAADMLDENNQLVMKLNAEHLVRQNVERENAKLRELVADMPKCEDCEAMLDCDECLRADASQKERKRLDYENAKLRELVRDMWLHSYCSIAKTREDDDRHIEDVIDRMRELGVEV